MGTWLRDAEAGGTDNVPGGVPCSTGAGSPVGGWGCNPAWVLASGKKV